jgi:pantoate--beta-alanine ligase
MLGVLNAEPLGKVDYVSIADAATMEELDRIEGPAVVSLAFRLGRPRLIDNILLG